MIVHATLHGVLARYLPDPRDRTPVELELPEGATLAEACELLGVPSGHVALFAVNGRRAAGERVLQDRDRITLFPPVAGGGPSLQAVSPWGGG